MYVVQYHYSLSVLFLRGSVAIICLIVWWCSIDQSADSDVRGCSSEGRHLSRDSGSAVSLAECSRTSHLEALRFCCLVPRRPDLPDLRVRPFSYSMPHGFKMYSLSRPSVLHQVCALYMHTCCTWLVHSTFICLVVGCRRSRNDAHVSWSCNR